MARVRSLEGGEAGILAGMVQGVFRLVFGRGSRWSTPTA